MQPTLLILAAGVGSRYGSLKQIDKLGPNGETIMDYSIHYAIKSGFGKVVFVIRKSIEADFKEIIVNKYLHTIDIDYVFQELDSLPAGFSPHPDRTKPYGTAHAILTAKKAINEPFVVINADDFYGEEAFHTIANFLNQPNPTNLPAFAMVGYYLKNTLSEFGGVSRGVCEVDKNDNLLSIKEITKIIDKNGKIEGDSADGSKVTLMNNQIVSMNFWGFTPTIFDKLEDMFYDFLKIAEKNSIAEFQIPTIIHAFLQTNQATIKVLSTSAKWFGVTYKEDKPMVIKKLQLLAEKQ